MATPGYLVKCKCAVARCAEWNEFLAAASSGSYSHSPFTMTDRYGTQTYWRNATFRCWSCGAYFVVKAIKGKLNPDHACDARCMASKGPNCECACGGKNHGGSWS